MEKEKKSKFIMVLLIIIIIILAVLLILFATGNISLNPDDYNNKQESSDVK